jgi:hypothetical protein
VEKVSCDAAAYPVAEHLLAQPDQHRRVAGERSFELGPSQRDPAVSETDGVLIASRRGFERRL